MDHSTRVGQSTYLQRSPHGEDTTARQQKTFELPDDATAGTKMIAEFASVAITRSFQQLAFVTEDNTHLALPISWTLPELGSQVDASTLRLNSRQRRFV